VVPESENAGVSTANDYAQAYSRLVTEPAVVGEAVSESEVGVDPWDVERIVSVEVAPNAPILQITTNSDDPEDASALANALGSGLSTFAEERADETGYQADLMAEALPPEDPALPDWALNVAVGAFAGLLVGATAALLWLDPRHHRRKAGKAQEEKQQLQREAVELEKHTARYQELEQEKRRLEKEMAQLEKSVERYRELEQEKQRLQTEVAELDKQRREAKMTELARIAERYQELEQEEQRLRGEMAGLEEGAGRYRELEQEKERLEKEMAQLEKSVERYRELRSNQMQESRQGEGDHDGNRNASLGMPSNGPRKEG
jgi:uncharacterized protein involved in exopolysaccharide biosynthesis